MRKDLLSTEFPVDYKDDSFSREEVVSRIFVTYTELHNLFVGARVTVRT